RRLHRARRPRRYRRGAAREAALRSALQGQSARRQHRPQQSRNAATDQGGRASAAGSATMIFRDQPSTNFDWNFFGTALVLAMIGCLLVYSATYYSEPDLHTFQRQILWVVIGLILCLAFLIVDYHVMFDIAPILYGIGIALLIYLLLWGKLTAHVKSWIHIGGFQFQP